MQPHAKHVIADGRGMHGREWCGANLPMMDGQKFLTMPRATNGKQSSVRARIFTVPDRIVVGCSCAKSRANVDPFFPQQPSLVPEVTGEGPYQRQQPWYSFGDRNHGILENRRASLTSTVGFLTENVGSGTGRSNRQLFDMTAVLGSLTESNQADKGPPEHPGLVLRPISHEL